MKILALDTSTNVAAAAIMEDDVLIGEFSCNRGKTHSERLMPMIDCLFEKTGLCAADMDVFSASIGPGSFTGLRIGVTTAKAMAFAAGKPVIGIHTLDALAYNIPGFQGLICPVIDARNDQVFTSIYKFNNRDMERLTDYMGIHINELVDIIRPMEGDIIMLGDACKNHIGYFSSELGERVRIAPPNVSLAKASSVAALARIEYMKGNLESCYDMVPFYLRKSQAEREKEMSEKRMQK